MRATDHTNSDRRPLVLMVGPSTAGGGMGTVCRQMRTEMAVRRWRLMTLDNSKSTAENRSTITAIAAHLLLLGRLAWAILRHRPAMVHLHTCSYRTFYRSMADILMARLLLRPVVLHIHGGYFHEFVSSLSGVWRWLVISHLRMARRVIVLGEVWRERLECIVGEGRTRVVPNGVAVSNRGRGVRRRGPLRVVWVGDLSAGKAPEDLIEAVARLAPSVRGRVCVDLIGGGSTARRELLGHRIAAQRLNSSVRMLGARSPHHTQAHIRHADVFVLSSHGEGMPLALLEAMACGLPAVVTRVGAVPEVVTDGVEAFIVDPGAVEDLAARLATLLSDASTRTRMGRCARLQAEKFGVDRFGAAVERVWLEVLGAERNPAAPNSHLVRPLGSMHGCG